MNSLWAVLHVHLRSLINAYRTDRRRTVTIALVQTLSALFFAAWGGNRLGAQVTFWRLQGESALYGGLWFTLIAIWVGLAGLVALAVVRQGMGDDETLLLLTLPIPPAQRLRILFAVMMVEWLSYWLVITAVTWTLALGWEAGIWVALFLTGAAVTSWLSTVATLLVLQRKMVRVRQAMVRGGVGFAMVVTVSWILAVNLPVQFGERWWGPAPILVVLLSVLIWQLGPGAAWAGRLYEEALIAMERRGAVRRARRLPGMGRLVRLLQARPGLEGAFFVKAMLSQSRNVLAWGRLLVIAAVLIFSPGIARALQEVGLTDLMIVTGFAVLLPIGAIFEYAPYAVSGEGARLTHYLVAPVTTAQILRAKLALFLIPALFFGMAVCLGIAIALRLTLMDLAMGMAMTGLVQLGYTGFVVWFSTWDADLDRSVEGFAQTLMQEEAPITPQRLWIINMSLLLLGAMGVILSWLPMAAALTLLALLDGLVLWLAWRFALDRMTRLIQG